MLYTGNFVLRCYVQFRKLGHIYSMLCFFQDNEVIKVHKETYVQTGH